MEKLKIYIVDDHKLFREGLKLLLSTQEFVQHVYEASSGEEFIENLSLVDCDVVLMDIEMPGMNGIETTEYTFTPLYDIFKQKQPLFRQKGRKAAEILF